VFSKVVVPVFNMPPPPEKATLGEATLPDIVLAVTVRIPLFKMAPPSAMAVLLTKALLDIVTCPC